MNKRQRARRRKSPNDLQGSVPVDPRLLAITLLLTTAAATLVRFWFPRAWGELESPTSVFYVGDARAFLSNAAHLLAGTPFDNGVPFHPPGWPFVLAAACRVLGSAPADSAVVKLLVACLGGATVGLTTWFASRVSGTGAMLAVALLGTFHFGHVVQSSVPTSEALYSLLLVLTLLLARRWIRGEASSAAWRLPLPFAVGCVAAFATLVRAEFALALFALPVVRWRLARAGVLAELGVYAIGGILALTPTTVSHWRSLSAFNLSRAERLPGPLPRFAPVTSYGAFNFAMANHPNADGGPNLDHPVLVDSREVDAMLEAGGIDLAHPGVHFLYIHGFREGLRWMASDPGAALGLMAQKAALMSGVFSQGYLHDNRFAGVSGVRRRVDQLDPGHGGMWIAHVLLVAIGAAVLWRQRDIRLLLAVPLITLLASTLLFYGYVRLGVAYVPVFWVLQGVAASALCRRVAPGGVSRRAPLVVLLSGLVLLGSEASGLYRTRVITVEGSRGPDGKVIEDETVTLTVHE